MNEIERERAARTWQTDINPKSAGAGVHRIVGHTGAGGRTAGTGISDRRSVSTQLPGPLAFHRTRVKAKICAQMMRTNPREGYTVDTRRSPRPSGQDGRKRELSGMKPGPQTVASEFSERESLPPV